MRGNSAAGGGSAALLPQGQGLAEEGLGFRQPTLGHYRPAQFVRGNSAAGGGSAALLLERQGLAEGFFRAHQVIAGVEPTAGTKV